MARSTVDSSRNYKQQTRADPADKSPAGEDRQEVFGDGDHRLTQLHETAFERDIARTDDRPDNRQFPAQDAVDGDRVEILRPEHEANAEAAARALRRALDR